MHASIGYSVPSGNPVDQIDVITVFPDAQFHATAIACSIIIFKSLVVIVAVLCYYLYYDTLRVKKESCLRARGLMTPHDSSLRELAGINKYIEKMEWLAACGLLHSQIQSRDQFKNSKSSAHKNQKIHFSEHVLGTCSSDKNLGCERLLPQIYR